MSWITSKLRGMHDCTYSKLRLSKQFVVMYSSSTNNLYIYDHGIFHYNNIIINGLHVCSVWVGITNASLSRLIRLSSPKLNIITVFGVIILYISMVLFVIPTQSKSVIHGLCIARLWFLALGVSLAFGTIIMKMFRVYVIFSNPTPKRKKVNTNQLAFHI